MKRKRNLKLPNGFGSIIYLGDNRRKPYGALKTIEWTPEGKPIRKYVGYSETWNGAYQILLEYNNNPYNLDNKSITFKEVFEKWKTIKEEKYINGEISKSTYKCLMSAYNKTLKILDDRIFIEIKNKEIQRIIDNSTLRYTGRNYIKILYNELIRYANDELELSINDFKLDIGKKEKSDKHYPFTNDEIELIKMETEFNDFAKLLMIYFYTGLRPSELLNIEIKNVFLDKDYMIGGGKTDAGKDRIIPIHSAIKSFILDFYNKNNTYLIINNGLKFSYDSYEDQFKKYMKHLNLEHTPHDTRHTFATKCDEIGINESDIKVLMGHSLANNVTQDVYIHKTAEKLKEIIERINY